MDLKLNISLPSFSTTWAHFEPRVLDAWVAKHLEDTRASIEERRSKDHSNYMPLPLEIKELVYLNLRSGLGAPPTFGRW